MKIVVNARFLTQRMTGVQRYAVEICLELKRMMGDNIELVSPCNIEQHEYAKKLSVKIIGSHKGHMWEQIDLPHYLHKSGNPLLLCLCNTAPLFYKNKIVTVHDVAFEALPQTFSKSFLYTYHFLIPRIIKSALHVITVSNFSKEEIVKYYGTSHDKISVVYNAVGEQFQTKYDKLLRECNYLLAVSSLNYRKNFIAVLKAFDLLEKDNQDVNLYIIGDLQNNSFKSIDIEHYKKNPHVKFLGRVSDDDLIRYYSNALAFVYPSVYEGFGIPPLEAQNCGCPVLVADIPPLHEVIENSGIYCNPQEIVDIALGMKKIVASSDMYKNLAHENIIRFSWEKSAKRVVDILKQYTNKN